MGQVTGLIVKTHAFGDAMLTTPAVRELIRTSDCRWWALTGPSAAPVWTRFPGVEKVFTAPFPPSGLYGRLSLLIWSLGMRSRLHEVERSWVFQMDRSTRRWVRFLTGSRMVSGGSQPLGAWEEARDFDPDVFAGRSYARIAGVNPSEFIPEFTPEPDEMDWARNLLGDGSWVAVAPGGGTNPRDTVLQKRWSIEKYGKILSMLRKRGTGVILLGGHLDRPVSSVLAESVSRDQGRVIDLTGSTDWGRTAAVLSTCGVFLGNDSGTAHAALAVGARSVVIFGPTDPACLYPEGSIIPVTSRISCAPCYSNTVFPGCSRDGEECMSSVSPEDVWTGLERAIHENHNS